MNKLSKSIDWDGFSGSGGRCAACVEFDVGGRTERLGGGGICVVFEAPFPWLTGANIGVCLAINSGAGAREEFGVLSVFASPRVINVNWVLIPSNS